MPRTNFNLDPSAPFSSDSKTPIPQREPRNSGTKATSSPVDDIDRLLDDAEHKASLPKVSDLPPGGGIPTISSTPPAPQASRKIEAAVTGRLPTEPQSPVDAANREILGETSKKRGGTGTRFKPGNPGRPKGVLVGRDRAARLRREQAEAEILAEGDIEEITPRQFFQRVLSDKRAAPELRRDAAKQLAAMEARGEELKAVEEILWDNLTSAQRRQGIDACKLLTDLRHISRKREPEFGMV